jgi:hypothetical protein
VLNQITPDHGKNQVTEAVTETVTETGRDEDTQ